VKLLRCHRSTSKKLLDQSSCPRVLVSSCPRMIAGCTSKFVSRRRSSKRTEVTPEILTDSPVRRKCRCRQGRRQPGWAERADVDTGDLRCAPCMYHEETQDNTFTNDKSELSLFRTNVFICRRSTSHYRLIIVTGTRMKV